MILLDDNSEDRRVPICTTILQSEKRFVKEMATATNQTQSSFISEIISYYIQRNQERVTNLLQRKIEVTEKTPKSRIFAVVESNELISNVVKKNYQVWLNGNKFVREVRFYELCMMDLHNQLIGTNKRIQSKKELMVALEMELNNYHAQMTAPTIDKEADAILKASKGDVDASSP